MKMNKAKQGREGRGRGRIKYKDHHNNNNNKKRTTTMK